MLYKLLPLIHESLVPPRTKELIELTMPRDRFPLAVADAMLEAIMHIIQVSQHAIVLRIK